MDKGFGSGIYPDPVFTWIRILEENKDCKGLNTKRKTRTREKKWKREEEEWEKREKGEEKEREEKGE